MNLFRALISTVLLLLTGCRSDHQQSALHPAGPPARAIEQLWWVILLICGVVFVVVIALTLYAVLKKPAAAAEHAKEHQQPPGGHDRFIVVAGIVVPAAILTGMVFFSAKSTVALLKPDTAFRIAVTGHQWWWDVEYPDHGIHTANEIHIPAGVPIQLELKTADVIHSFWIPNLHGKMDMIPEVKNSFWIQADTPGVWRAQCAEFCGLQHAWMALMVVALPAEDFDRWVKSKQLPHSESLASIQQRGQQVFFKAGCNNCHAIKGTPAVARIGPDLTHIGSRMTLGAGAVPNNKGNLSGWVVNPQAIKPGNLMPRTFLEPEDLQALVAYLEELE